MKWCYVLSSKQPEYHEERMCTGHVTKVCFVGDDRFLVTSGGTDAGLMQWTFIDCNEFA